MNFLKALKADLLKFLGVAQAAAPILAAAFPGTSFAALLPALVSIVISVETLFANVAGATGAQKYAAALPQVVNLLKASEFIAGKKILDETLLEKAAGEFLQATVDFMNAVEHPGTGAPTLP